MGLLLFAAVFYAGGWVGSWINSFLGVDNYGGWLGTLAGFFIPVTVIYVVYNKFKSKKIA